MRILSGRKKGYLGCLVLDIKEVIGVCISDLMTDEMYYARPVSPRVHQLDRARDLSRVLSFDSEISVRERYILLRDEIEEYSPLIQAIAGDTQKKIDSLKATKLKEVL